VEFVGRRRGALLSQLAGRKGVIEVLGGLMLTHVLSVVIRASFGHSWILRTFLGGERGRGMRFARV